MHTMIRFEFFFLLIFFFYVLDSSCNLCFL